MADDASNNPYDFSDWELGKDALSDIEVEVFGLLEQAVSAEPKVRDWPDLDGLHEAVERLVRRQLEYAFGLLRAGGWAMDLDGTSTNVVRKPQSSILFWTSEIDPVNHARPIHLGPGQLPSVFMSGLVELHDGTAPTHGDLSWNDLWNARSKTLNEWRQAVSAIRRTLNGLRADRPSQGFEDDDSELDC